MEVASKWTECMAKSSGASRFAKKRLAASLRTRLCRTKRSQFGHPAVTGSLAVWGPRALFVQTNPIGGRCRLEMARKQRRTCGERGRSPYQGLRAKRSQFGGLRPAVAPGSPCLRGQDWCATKPIAPNVRNWAGAEEPVMEPGGAKDAKQTQSPRDTPVFHCSIIPVFQARGCCTNEANWADGASKETPCGVTTNTSWRAKQTQFRLPCRSGDRRSLGPIVRNKPNSGWREDKGKCFMAKGLRGIRAAKDFGKTKPIPGGTGWDGA